MRRYQKKKNLIGKLTGRSILVSLSHGWFFQNHPDPRGRKLDLIRNVFAPRLRRITGGSVLFFEVSFIGTISLLVTDILYGMIKFIPVKDERTGHTKRWAIGK